jgi:hypothetical protein
MTVRTGRQFLAERAMLTSSSNPSRPPDGPLLVLIATTRYTGGKHRTYQDHEIDYFGVCCPDTDAVYLVPIEDIGPHTSGGPARRAC